MSAIAQALKSAGRIDNVLHAAAKAEVPLCECPEAQRFDAVYSTFADSLIPRSPEVSNADRVAAAYLIGQLLMAVRAPSYVNSDWLEQFLVEDPVLLLARGLPKTTCRDGRYVCDEWTVSTEVHLGGLPPLTVEGDRIAWPSDTLAAYVRDHGRVEWLVNFDSAVDAITSAESITFMRRLPLHSGRARELHYQHPKQDGDLASMGRLVMLSGVRGSGFLAGCVNAGGCDSVSSSSRRLAEGWTSGCSASTVLRFAAPGESTATDRPAPRAGRIFLPTAQGAEADTTERCDALQRDGTDVGTGLPATSEPTTPWSGALDEVALLAAETWQAVEQAARGDGSHQRRPAMDPLLTEVELKSGQHGLLPDHAARRAQSAPEHREPDMHVVLAELGRIRLTRAERAFAEALLEEGTVELAAARLGLNYMAARQRLSRVLKAIERHRDRLAQ